MDKTLITQMSKYLLPLISKAPAIAIAGLCFMMIAAPASANNGKGNGNNKPAQSTPPAQTTTTQTTTQPAPITQSGTVTTPSITSPFLTLGLSDLNKSFQINFDGNVNTNTVAGLSSEAVFTFTGFTVSQNTTIATFDVKLTNTSSGGISSRVSGLGFDTSSKLLSSRVLNPGDQSLFDNTVLNGSFPNQFGAIDVCFTDGNRCQGGQSGGARTGKEGSFSFALTFEGALNNFTLDNFGVRYQSIDGNGFVGDSGTGSAVSVKPVFDKPIDGTKPPEDLTPTPPKPPEQPKPTPKPVPRDIPEPSTVGAMLLVSAIALRFGKKREAAEVEEGVN